jgi:ketosteroid isomerase-like protein
MGGLQLVKDAYERFGRGDVASLLALFDPGIEWRLAEGHPYSPKGEVRIGPKAVVENFFKRASGEWDGWTISPASSMRRPTR